MPNLDASFVIHNFSLKKDAKQIKKKPQKIHPFKELLFKKEIEKYLNAGFIKPINYSEWMANIVLVSKPSGEIWVLLILEISIMHVLR